MLVILLILALAVVGLALAVVFVNEARKNVICDNMRLNREVNDSLHLRDQIGTLQAELNVQKALVNEAKVQSDFHFNKYQDSIKQYNDLIEEHKMHTEFTLAVVNSAPVMPTSAVKQSRPSKSTKKTRRNK